MDERLKRFQERTGHPIVVVTLDELEDGALDGLARKLYESLPLSQEQTKKAALLLVERAPRRVRVHVGPELKVLFPEPTATEKIQHHVDPYFDGMRPDLGIHAALDYIFRVIQGRVRVEATSETEKLEEESLSGRGAGGIFSLFLAPYLAFMVGGLWGIYATHFGVQRGVRLFLGAVFGSGTAKAVAIAMSWMGQYSEQLWYFILAISIPLALFGSLTEFWMSGEWSGIPRIKDPVKRKPEDNMGI